MSKKIISAVLAIAMIVSMSATMFVTSVGAAADTDYAADRDALLEAIRDLYIKGPNFTEATVTYLKDLGIITEKDGKYVQTEARNKLWKDTAGIDLTTEEFSGSALNGYFFTDGAKFITDAKLNEVPGYENTVGYIAALDNALVYAASVWYYGQDADNEVFEASFNEGRNTLVKKATGIIANINAAFKKQISADTQPADYAAALETYLSFKANNASYNAILGVNPYYQVIPDDDFWAKYKSLLVDENLASWVTFEEMKKVAPEELFAFQTELNKMAVFSAKEVLFLDFAAQNKALNDAYTALIKALKPDASKIVSALDYTAQINSFLKLEAVLSVFNKYEKILFNNVYTTQNAALVANVLYAKEIINYIKPENVLDGNRLFALGLINVDDLSKAIIDGMAAMAPVSVATDLSLDAEDIAKAESLIKKVDVYLSNWSAWETNNDYKDLYKALKTAKEDLQNMIPVTAGEAVFFQVPEGLVSEKYKDVEYKNAAFTMYFVPNALSYAAFYKALEDKLGEFAKKTTPETDLAAINLRNSKKDRLEKDLLAYAYLAGYVMEKVEITKEDETKVTMYRIDSVASTIYQMYFTAIYEAITGKSYDSNVKYDIANENVKAFINQWNDGYNVYWDVLDMKSVVDPSKTIGELYKDSYSGDWKNDKGTFKNMYDVAAEKIEGLLKTFTKDIATELLTYQFLLKEIAKYYGLTNEDVAEQAKGDGKFVYVSILNQYVSVVLDELWSYSSKQFADLVAAAKSYDSNELELFIVEQDKDDPAFGTESTKQQIFPNNKQSATATIADTTKAYLTEKQIKAVQNAIDAKIAELGLDSLIVTFRPFEQTIAEIFDFIEELIGLSFGEDILGTYTLEFADKQITFTVEELLGEVEASIQAKAKFDISVGKILENVVDILFNYFFTQDSNVVSEKAVEKTETTEAKPAKYVFDEAIKADSTRRLTYKIVRSDDVVTGAKKLIKDSDANIVTLKIDGADKDFLATTYVERFTRGFNGAETRTGIDYNLTGALESGEYMLVKADGALTQSNLNKIDFVSLKRADVDVKVEEQYSDFFNGTRTVTTYWEIVDYKAADKAKYQWARVDANAADAGAADIKVIVVDLSNATINTKQNPVTANIGPSTIMEVTAATVDANGFISTPDGNPEYAADPSYLVYTNAADTTDYSKKNIVEGLVGDTTFKLAIAYTDDGAGWTEGKAWKVSNVPTGAKLYWIKNNKTATPTTTATMRVIEDGANLIKLNGTNIAMPLFTNVRALGAPLAPVTVQKTIGYEDGSTFAVSLDAVEAAIGEPLMETIREWINNNAGKPFTWPDWELVTRTEYRSGGEFSTLLDGIDGIADWFEDSWLEKYLEDNRMIDINWYGEWDKATGRWKANAEKKIEFYEERITDDKVKLKSATEDQWEFDDVTDAYAKLLGQKWLEIYYDLLEKAMQADPAKDADGKAIFGAEFKFTGFDKLTDAQKAQIQKWSILNLDEDGKVVYNADGYAWADQYVNNDETKPNAINIIWNFLTEAKKYTYNRQATKFNYNGKSFTNINEEVFGLGRYDAGYASLVNQIISLFAKNASTELWELGLENIGNVNANMFNLGFFEGVERIIMYIGQNEELINLFESKKYTEDYIVYGPNDRMYSNKRPAMTTPTYRWAANGTELWQLKGSYPNDLFDAFVTAANDLFGLMDSNFTDGKGNNAYKAATAASLKAAYEKFIKATKALLTDEGEAALDRFVNDVYRFAAAYLGEKNGVEYTELDVYNKLCDTGINVNQYMPERAEIYYWHAYKFQTVLDNASQGNLYSYATKSYTKNYLNKLAALVGKIDVTKYTREWAESFDALRQQAAYIYELFKDKGADGYDVKYFDGKLDSDMPLWYALKVLNAVQAAYDEKDNNTVAAVDALKEETLKLTVAAADALDAIYYSTEDSAIWDAFIQAYTKALEVLLDNRCSLDDVQNANDALAAAMEELSKIEKPEGALTVASLEAKIAAAEALLGRADKTDDASKKALKEAIQLAKKYLQFKKAVVTTTEIGDEVAKLDSAMKALNNAMYNAAKLKKATKVLEMQVVIANYTDVSYNKFKRACDNAYELAAADTAKESEFLAAYDYVEKMFNELKEAPKAVEEPKEDEPEEPKQSEVLKQAIECYNAIVAEYNALGDGYTAESKAALKAALDVLKNAISNNASDAELLEAIVSAKLARASLVVPVPETFDEE